MDCINCSNPFRESNLPKLLVYCGHTICQSCLLKLYSPPKIICPECKHENIINDLNLVPTNLALLNLNLSHNNKTETSFSSFKRLESNFENVNSSKRGIPSQKCQVHQKTIEAFCLHDYESLCIDCILSEKYKNKEILSIEKAATILLDQLKSDLKISSEKNQKLKKNLETFERLEKNLLFWKKRSEDEIKTFFEEFHKVLKEKELKSLESNQTNFAQNTFYLKTSKKNTESNLNCLFEYHKIMNSLISNPKNEDFLSNMKLVVKMKSKLASFGEITIEEPSYENYVFNKENEIKTITSKLKESYGNSLNPTYGNLLNQTGVSINLKERPLKENVNNTICYFSSPSEEKRSLNNMSALMLKPITEKENNANLMPSKSSSPFSLDKKGIKTTKSVNFKNFSNNLFEQRQSPNIKLNRSKSPAINQRKYSKPDNISYHLMRKLKTDIEENDVSKFKKTINPKEIGNSVNSYTKDLSLGNKNNSKSIGTLFVTKKISLENEKKYYKMFVLGGFSVDKQFSIEEFDSKGKDWSVRFSHPNNKAKFGSVYYNNSIVLFGGKSEGKRLNNFYKYDCFSYKMTEMNIKLTVAKSGFGYCSKDDEIYICGGNDGATILDTFECYNLKTLTIKKLPNMNHKRDELAMVIDSNANIYAIGGYCNQNNCLNSVEKFDFKLNKWVLIANLIEPRRSLNSIVLGHNIYAIGGFNGCQYLNTVERYDEINEKWVGSKPMKESRCTFSAIGLPEEGSFIVMGGFNNTPLNNCEIFNEKKDTWDDFRNLEMKRFMHSCNMFYLDN